VARPATPGRVFYIHALGDNRTVSYVYALLPFQALGGMNVWTTRLPAAVGGVLTILLMYWVAGRLGGGWSGRRFDTAAGLLAAGLLAINPWHVQQCRFGHEASLSPLLVCGVLAAHLRARLPLAGCAVDDAPVRPVAALLAGILWGGACYGYAAIRIFLPLLLVASVAVCAPEWRRRLRTGRGRLAAALFGAGFAVTFGPTAVSACRALGAHRPSRGGFVALDARDGLAARLAKAAGRYFGHSRRISCSVAAIATNRCGRRASACSRGTCCRCWWPERSRSAPGRAVRPPRASC